MKQEVRFVDLGLIDYQQAWDLQEKLFNEVVERKVRNRNLPPEQQEAPVHYLLFCEHPHVYTLGKSGSTENLLAGPEELKEKSVSFYKINRGGDITYHGPGQIVAYPILDLDFFFTDIHKYLRFLEEAVIMTLKDFGVESSRYEGYTGVWIEPDNPVKARKICAMGVRCSRWVTMHGLAFNIATDLSYFGNIVPCGITDKAVTSLSKETGTEINPEEVKPVLQKHLADLFEMDLIPFELPVSHSI